MHVANIVCFLLPTNAFTKKTLRGAEYPTPHTAIPPSSLIKDDALALYYSIVLALFNSINRKYFIHKGPIFSLATSL
jgi:hypothetical protein